MSHLEEWVELSKRPASNMWIVGESSDETLANCLKWFKDRDPDADLNHLLQVLADARAAGLVSKKPLANS